MSVFTEYRVAVFGSVFVEFPSEENRKSVKDHHKLIADHLRTSRRVTIPGIWIDEQINLHDKRPDRIDLIWKQEEEAKQK